MVLDVHTKRKQTRKILDLGRIRAKIDVQNDTI